MHPDLYTTNTAESGPALSFRGMSALAAILTFLKAAGIGAITAPWWMVTAPFWAPLSLAVIIVLITSRPRVRDLQLGDVQAMTVAKPAPKQAASRAGVQGAISGKKYNAKGTRSWAASPKSARQAAVTKALPPAPVLAPSTVHWSPFPAGNDQDLGGWTRFAPVEIPAPVQPPKVDTNDVLAWFAGEAPTSTSSKVEQEIAVLLQKTPPSGEAGLARPPTNPTT